jgi:hypothetical protein
MSKKLSRTIRTSLLSLLFVVSGCGDFPDYTYDRSNEYCVMSFPFAGGIIGRQYIGYFRIISTLQYMDEDPTYKVIATGPSHVDLDAGSFQKLIINERVFTPSFEPSHLEAELQLWGPAYVFKPKESNEIYELLQQGHDLNFLGRIEVGHQYDTDVYNYFFDSANEPFRECINRLLDENDKKTLGINQQ